MLLDMLRRHPIVQAPMAGVQGSELTIAVCEAGGIGSLPAAMLDVDALRLALEKIHVGTNQPYNVNFFCHRVPEPDEHALRRWCDSLRPYYEELGADKNTPAGPARSPFGAEALAVLAEFEPPVVSFHFGLPEPQLLAGVKAWGAQVLGCATSVEEAEWLQAKGADGVIAQGIEAGGHQGRFLDADHLREYSCLELTKAISSQVTLPVIAAGGVATREHAQAALAAGAEAVQVGSAYLQATEAKTSAIHRLALQSNAARSTALTNVFSGRRARGIVNRFVQEQGPISAIAPEFPQAAAAVAPLRTAAEALGSGDFSPLWSGQNGYLSQALPAADITRAIRPTNNRES